MSRASLERRLRNMTAEIKSLEAEVAVMNEQVAHFRDGADEARMRSLVSETPQAGAEYRKAQRSLDVMEKNRQKMLERIAKLELKQDMLLDALTNL